MIDDPEFKQQQISHINPDIPIPPQIESPLGLNQFISDGDLWTEVDKLQEFGSNKFDLQEHIPYNNHVGFDIEILLYTISESKSITI